MDNKRNKPMSVKQKDILIECMRSHPQLKQKFSSNCTRQDSITIWKDITNMLNASPGAKKEWKEWRKTWHDIHSRTKTKKALINAQSSKTGGGSAIPDLSQSEEKIAEIIGDTAIRGLGVVESQVQEIEVDDENPTNSADFPKSMNHLDETNRLKRNLAIEHNYIRNTLQNIEPVNIAQVEKTKTTRNVATQRLDKAVDQSNKTIALLHEKVQLKKDYLRKKLDLMERNVVANEHIASELKYLKDILLAKCHNVS
ncbi:hypothetical protein JTB14_022846 [Gonioctena quinquepunctata]|nr:hypothetical protein JTB14_022846 [Gonioctena quinquepunctata]